MIYYILSFFCCNLSPVLLVFETIYFEGTIRVGLLGSLIFGKDLGCGRFLRWVGSTIQVGLAISRGKNLRSDLFDPINTLNRQSSSQSYGVPYSLILISISLWSNFPKQYMQQPSCLLIFLSISSAAISSIPLILLS